MDFSDVDNLAGYRDQAAAWVDRHVDRAWAEQQRVTGSYHTPPLHALLAAQGWLGAGWPAEYGGTDNDPAMAAAIFDAIANREGGRPFMLVAKTTKGNGVSYMENIPIWHYRSPNKDEYRQAIDELESAR